MVTRSWPGPSLRGSGGCLGKGLIEISDDVLDVLNANCEADQFGGDSSCGLLLFIEL